MTNLSNKLSIPLTNLSNELSIPLTNLSNKLSIPLTNLSNELSIPLTNLSNELSNPPPNLSITSTPLAHLSFSPNATAGFSLHSHPPPLPTFPSQHPHQCTPSTGLYTQPPSPSPRRILLQQPQCALPPQNPTLPRDLRRRERIIAGDHTHAQRGRLQLLHRRQRRALQRTVQQQQPRERQLRLQQFARQLPQLRLTLSSSPPSPERSSPAGLSTPAPARASRVA